MRGRDLFVLAPWVIFGAGLAIILFRLRARRRRAEPDGSDTSPFQTALGNARPQARRRIRPWPAPGLPMTAAAKKTTAVPPTPMADVLPTRSAPSWLRPAHTEKEDSSNGKGSP